MTLIAQPIESFLAHCLMERGFAANSIRNYRMNLIAAESWLRTKDRALLTANASEFGGYLQSLTRNGLKSSTIRLAWNAIQSFLGFATEILGIDRKLVSANFDAPEVGEPLPVVLNRHDTERLLQGPAKYDRTYLRDQAVLETLEACGLRISELTSLRITDVNLKDRHLRVIGKGGKERIVPFHHKAASAIQKYLDELRPNLVKDKTDKLWLTLRGKPMGNPCVRKLVEECRDRANIGKKVTPHTLRHGFATHLVGGGANLRVVQELMGHAKLTTTEIYLHLDPTRLKAVHQKFHPRG